MGAADFSTYGLGRTPGDAFVEAVRRAQWEYGHGGYTGTIAEKGDFELFVLPPRVDPAKVVEFARRAEWVLMHERHPQHYDKPRPDDKKALAWLRDKLGRTLADRIIMRITGDKWGPCAAFEVKGAKATDIKKIYGRAGTRDKVFLFAGMASE